MLVNHSFLCNLVKLFLMNFVALDFETANYLRTSACALGVAVVQDSKIVATREWLIKPEPSFFQFTYIHGITEYDVQDAPTFPQIWKELKDIIDYQTLVAHNASFDMGVLRSLFQHYDLVAPKSQYHCSLQIAKRTWRNLSAYNLKAMADFLNVELQHHNALSDTLACAKIILAAGLHLQTNNLVDLRHKLSIKIKDL